LAQSWAEGGEAARKIEERFSAHGQDMETIRLKTYEQSESELREIENCIAKTHVFVAFLAYCLHVTLRADSTTLRGFLHKIDGKQEAGNSHRDRTA
jgi:hypothetical protein